MNTLQREEQSFKKFGKLVSSSTGTENYYVMAPFFTGKKLLMTDGVKEIFESANCFWVGDVIASYFSKIKGKHFVHACVSKNIDDNGALFTMDEGNDREEDIFVKQEIEFSDIPKNLSLFIQVMDDQDNYCVMMPEEY